MINEAFFLYLKFKTLKMRLFYTLLLLAAITELFAQYTITPSQKPAIGDNYNYIYVDTTGIALGSSGANQVWNYTNLVIPATPTVNTISYLDAITSVTNYTWYPGAYMAIVGLGGGFTAFDSDPNNYSLNWVKTMIGGALSTKYADPLTKYHYPIAFGSIFSDSVKFAAYDEPNGGYLGPYLNYGVNSYTCTGYGTLNLPNGVSLPNTLKLNIQYFKTYLDPITSVVNGQDTAYYEEYFNTISKFPILAFYKADGHSTYFSSTITHHSRDIKLNSMVVAGLKNNQLSASDISVFPNPSNGNLNVELSGSEFNEKPVFTLQNALGQVIDLKFQATTDDAHFMINLSDPQPGLYFLIIKTQEGQATKKLLVE